MPFTFTVETGAVVTGANSYVPVAFADDYFEIDPNFFPIWDALETANKQIFLAWATRILDQKVQWRGYKADEDSALRWPRAGVYDRDKLLIADDEIPEQLKQAVCEVLKFMQSQDPTTSQDVENVKVMKLDVLEIEFQEGTSQTSLPPLINNLLVGLGQWPTGSFGFARIARA